MIVEKRVKLRNNIYYIMVSVEYKKDENNIVKLCINDYKDSYYDGGNFSRLIEKIEKSYDDKKAEGYDENIGFMADVLYLYDRIPFLCGIRDVYISDKDNLPSSIGYISKNEIEKYIKENNVKMTFDDNFKLYDERTWKV